MTRCRRCNSPLTAEASIRRGIGPECVHLAVDAGLLSEGEMLDMIHDPAYLAGLLKARGTPRRVLDAAAKRGGWRVQRAIIDHPEVPEELLVWLRHHGAPSVRRPARLRLQQPETFPPYQEK